MKVIKDGVFDNLHGQSLSVLPNQSITYTPGTISSGTYAINFSELPWVDCELTCQQSRYVAVGGTQIVSVSGKVTSTGTTINSTAEISFSLPFLVPSGTQQIGGTSTVTNADESLVLTSACWFDPVPLIQGEPPSVILKVFVGLQTNQIWFNVNIILPIE